MKAAPSILPLLSLAFVFAEAPAQAAAPWSPPPGWTATRGGEGGQEISVTTLDPTGPGSIAEALQTKGPKTIVFKVGGVIDLAGRSLKISTPQVTVAGETAPSPGITLIKGGIAITADDVILRHLRVRVGGAGNAKKSGWEVDGISVVGAKEVIVDHCSIAWATDENLSASGPRFEGATPDEWRSNTSHRVTFSHCLIAEGLKDSTHKKGVHSMGSLIHDNTSGILILGNLFISNHERNPLLKGGARGVVVNNLVHNPGSYALRYGLVESEWTGYEWQRGWIACVGNVLRQGADTRPMKAFAQLRGPCDVWFSDNLLLDRDGESLVPAIESADPRGNPSTAADQDQRLLEKPPLWPEGLVAKPAAETVSWVLENVGARPWDRDAVDRRLVEEARKGGGRIIDSEEEVGGYEALAKP